MATREIKQLIHNGVLIPDAYKPQGFTITFRGKPIPLNPLQEEMAVKFAQKFGTPYVEDATFRSNFMKAFAVALGLKEKIRLEDFDWTPITKWMETARYMVEPSGIFMGRGKHPDRGKWKPSIETKDVTLNLSPDAPIPPGEWAGREWRPGELWIARWTDKLNNKVKYVWF